MPPEYQYLLSTGVIVPDTADVLETVRDEFRATFGDDLDVSDSTPQGVLIAAETVARMASIRNTAAIANQINPDFAGGIFLDSIGALTGVQKFPATRSLARGVVITGQPGTIIVAGSRASNGSGTAVFETVGQVVIGNTGTAVVDFQSVEAGPVVLAAGALTRIVAGGVLGWETVNNPTEAELGSYVESDASFRVRRRLTLARQGISTAEAITSALYSLPDVKSVVFRENVASTNQDIDGLTIGPHSVYVCVDGGTNLEVAQVLLENKGSGVAWTGSTAVDVVEPTSGQTYRVYFDRPTIVPIRTRVTVRKGTSTVDPQVVIPQVIVAYANGDGGVFGEPGFATGQDVSPFELAGAINQVYPGLFVSKVEIGLADGTSWQTTEIDIALNAKATTTANLVQVVVV